VRAGFSFLLFVLYATVLFAGDYTYTQKIKDVNCFLTVKITENSGVRTIYAADDYYFVENTSRAKIGGGVQEWYLKDKKNDTELKAVREGNKINIEGRLKGKEFKKEHGIDDRPWHQLFTWDYFVRSNEKRIEFWALRPEDPASSGILVAYKEKEEKITMAGLETDAYNVKVTLGGLLSIFWTGDYWYRKSDGFYVRSKPTGNIFVELNKQENK